MPPRKRTLPKTPVALRVAKKDRRNLKLWADGARESVLKPHIPGYTDALERGWRAERDYHQLVCNEYHAQIPWRLQDYEEPELPLPVYDKFAKTVPEDLSTEELETKRMKVDTMNARIARPLGNLLAKLAGINSPPKARQAFQQYMHESYETDIAPAVKARWEAAISDIDTTSETLPNIKKKKGPDAPFRAKVARELFRELSEDDQEGLRRRAKEEAQKAREEYLAAMKQGPSKTPEARQKCIDNLGQFMATVLRGVTEYTGLHGVAIFGGPMPVHGGELRTLHCAWGRNHSSPAVNFPS
ncbi:hypothetical protein C8R46DRAFT_1238661 [Mycena filopes]|nr:hypothetical protein C8R46DRAFT_1238661 [Mycena filopes]